MKKLTGKTLALVSALGASDAPSLGKIGIPTIVFAPFRKENKNHGANESIALKDLVLVKKIIKEFCK